MSIPSTLRLLAARLCAVGAPSFLLLVLGPALATGTQAQTEPALTPEAHPTRDPSDSTLTWPTRSDDGRVVADTLGVSRRRLTLQEIIERSRAGERSKLAGHRDLRCTIRVRTALYWDDHREIEETVLRNYSDADGFSRAVQLAQRKREFRREDDTWVEETDDGDPAPVRVETEGYPDFEDLPFFLEEADQYRFELVDRHVRKDHVIFEIAFRPKSEFKPLPRGRVFVDTTAYRIVHEEYDFEHNPYPLFLRDVRRIARFWEALPTGEWVFTRMVLEVDLRNFAFGRAPEKVAVAIERSDFQFDQGYDERLFGER